ncbi:hypothetical protein P3342_007935 [Pyrenophora teres f. teres]|nr:hypothetical protein P3342_007935 [Pyrenophora teres f. teres]
MPPVLSRKRLRSDSPKAEPPAKRARDRKPPAPTRRGKETVFQTLDAPPRVKHTLSQTKALLEQEDDESELSELESSENDFEDVPLSGGNKAKEKATAQADEDDSESEDNDWEDALGAHHHTKPDHGPTPVITGDIALTLSAAPRNAFERSDGKRGPSKVQRQIRNVTHCMHVQYLMYHNLMRNTWIQDKEVQKILVENMSAGCWRELEKYWNDAGITDGLSRAVVQKAPSPPRKETASQKGKWRDSGKSGVKVYESPQKRSAPREDKITTSKAKDTPKNARRSRDWGVASEPLEPKTPNLSAGDPLLRLLKYLSAYWKAKYRVTAPSLRKRGYLSPSTLEAEIKTWKNDPDHPDTFGERIDDLHAFRDRARKCEGSAASPDKLSEFYARGAAADKARQVLAYLIAFSADGTAKDVTTRYLPKHQWPGRTKGFRMPIEKVPIHNKRGKVKRWEEWDWFKSLMRPYSRPHDKRQPWDEVEDEGDLIPVHPEKKKDMDEEGGKETLQGYKNSAEYVLERHLRREEALKPGAKIIRHFVTGKGDNEKAEPVYRRKDVVLCKTQESWHKEGREVLEGEQPLKLVPMRAVTVTRKREIEERERIEGGKVKQGLYSKAQTDWIIPDPIVDGKIPRNAFGNIDVYVPTMVPKGAVHIPLKGTARVCRKLNIDYAEACTGFEFGKQRAVPVLTGVVVAQENEDMLIDAWEAEEAEKQRKERAKREKFLLALWRRFASGLRVVNRMREEYGEEIELPAEAKIVPPKEKDSDEGGKQSQWEVFQNHTDFEGGFVRDEAEASGGGFVPEQSHPASDHDEDMAGGFLPASQDEPVHGDLTIDHGEKKEASRAAISESTHRTPISLTQALQQPPSEQADEDSDMDVDPGEKSKQDQTDSEEEEDNPPPKPTRRKSSSTRGRSNPRARASQPSIRKRKATLQSPPTAQRITPKHAAARQSNVQVKSHFFAEAASDAETDLTDMTDRASPKKAARGRGGARARGRGRPRGRAGKAKD